MILEKVVEILVEELDLEVEEVKPESSIQDDLGADSLDMVEVIMALEDEFDVKVADEDTAKIKTVSDVVNYIKEKQAA